LIALRPNKKEQPFKISNAVPGAAGYTSARRARELVERGIAEFEGEHSIRLLPESACNAMRRADLEERLARMTAEEIDQEINKSRNGVVSWDGARVNGHRRPGEVRS
jgi:hypothetical protein